MFYGRPRGGGFILLLILLLLFGRPLLSFGLSFILIIIGAVLVYFLYWMIASSISANKTKANFNKKDDTLNGKVSGDDLDNIDGYLSSYFNKNPYYPINNNISLKVDNHYKNIANLYLCLNGEAVINLEDLKSEHFNMYDKITSSLIDFVKTKRDIVIENTTRNIYEKDKYIKQIDDKEVNVIEDNLDSLVNKPEVNDIVLNNENYVECILLYLTNVNYGTSNSNEYVKGHKKALKKYVEEVINNNEKIYIVENKLSDEISSFNNKSSLEDKGYYDGLLYVLKSIRKAKALVSNRMSSILM